MIEVSLKSFFGKRIELLKSNAIFSYEDLIVKIKNQLLIQWSIKIKFKLLLQLRN